MLSDLVALQLASGSVRLLSYFSFFCRVVSMPGYLSFAEKAYQDVRFASHVDVPARQGSLICITTPRAAVQVPVAL